MPYKSLTVANTFLEMGYSRGLPIDPMKLQKLVYFAHGWYLAIYDKPLIDEEVQAWEFGPVIPSIYHKFKGFGPNPIDCFEGKSISDPDDLAFLIRFWEVYGNLNGVQLANFSHHPNGPWTKTRQETSGRKNVVIPDSDIKLYFSQIASDNRDAR